jgi:hypothetical protein
MPGPVRFWRQGRHEVDFVLPGVRGAADAIECKWSPDRFDPEGMHAFRALHPRGRNYLACPGVPRPHVRRFGELEVQVVDPRGLPAGPT